MDSQQSRHEAQSRRGQIELEKGILLLECTNHDGANFILWCRLERQANDVVDGNHRVGTEELPYGTALERQVDLRNVIADSSRRGGRWIETCVKRRHSSYLTDAASCSCFPERVSQCCVDRWLKLSVAHCGADPGAPFQKIGA